MSIYKNYDERFLKTGPAVFYVNDSGASSFVYHDKELSNPVKYEDVKFLDLCKTGVVLVKSDESLALFTTGLEDNSSNEMISFYTTAENEEMTFTTYANIG